MRFWPALLFTAATAWSADLPTTDGALPVPGANGPNDQAAVAAFLAANGWETTDPLYARTLEYLTTHAGIPKDSNVPAWNKKYYDYAVDFTGRCNRIAEALADRPMGFRNAWLTYYAERMISYRIDYNTERILRAMAAIPNQGDYVTIADRSALIQELDQRYQWSSQAPAKQLQIAAGLAGINGGLRQVGGVRGPTAADESRLLAGDDDWRAAYVITAGSEMLFPSARWVNTQTEFAADIPAVTVETAATRHLYLGLAGAGPNGEVVHLRLDIEGNQVVSAVATIPDANNHQYPVYPLWQSDLGLGLHPDPDEEPASSDDDFGDLGLSLDDLDDDLKDAAPLGSGPQRWFRLSGDTLTGFGRIHYAWGKHSKRVHQFSLTATISGMSATGSYVLVKPSEAKRPRPTRQPEAEVVAITAPPSGDTLTGTWSTQFGNDGSGVAVGSESIVANGSEARLQWVSGNKVPHSRGPNTRGNNSPQEPGMPLSGGWSSPLIDNGLVFLNYYKPSGDVYVLGARPVPNDPIENSRFDMMRLHTDEYMHAFDSATGATKWRLRIADRGINWMGFNKGGPGTSAGVGGGKVVWLSSVGEVFAADQVTGELLWSNSIGLRHEAMWEERRLRRQADDLFGSRNDFQGAVVIADNVAVVPDHLFNKGGGIYRYDFNNGLIGFDLHTGRELWRLAGVTGSQRFQQGAQIWRHNDKAYVLATDRHETVLIDPATGQVIDRARGLINKHWGLTIGPDIVVGDLLSDPEDSRSATHPAGYRLTPDGFTHVWTLDARYSVRPGGGVFMNDHLFLQSHGDFHGIVCVNPADGSIVAEEPCNIGGGEHSPFLVGTGDRLIAAMDRTAGLIVLSADPAQLTGSATDWRLTLATGYCGSVVPAIVDGRMVIRTPDRLIAFDLRTEP